MSKRVNCRSDYRFQVDLTTPNTSGNLAAPTAGTVTGIKLRLSQTPGGSAFNAAVNDLGASEASAKAGRFYVDVDAALLATHVLAAVGDGGTFYAVWSKSGDLDKASIRFTAVDGETA